MEYDLILARSVTFAQRMQKALLREGIRCQIYRAPRNLTDLGCAYAVQIAPVDRLHALHVLYGAKLAPIQLFAYRNGTYLEVGL